MKVVCLLTILVAAELLGSVCSAPTESAGGGVAWVGEPTATCPNGAPCRTFIDALTDGSVSTLYLVANVTLDPAAIAEHHPRGSLYPLARDVTIASAPGGPMRQLDMAFAPPAVQVGNVTVTFRNIRIANGRPSVGMMLDMFSVGAPGAAMVLQDAAFWRYVGLPADETANLMSAYARPPRWPGEQRLRRLSDGCTPAAPADLLFVDLAVAAGQAGATGVSARRTFDMRMVNVTRECEVVVPESCYRSFTRDWCVRRMIEEHVRQQGARGGPLARSLAGPGAAGPVRHSGRGSPGALAGIAIGAAVGTLAVVAAALLVVRHVLIVRRSRERERAQEARVRRWWQDAAPVVAAGGDKPCSGSAVSASSRGPATTCSFLPSGPISSSSHPGTAPDLGTAGSGRLARPPGADAV